MVARSVSLFFCLLLLAGPADAARLAGRVMGVADGDTVTVLDAANQQHKIRIAGIDAPEKKQAFGNRSKQYLSYLVFGKWVNVEYTKRDRYGRIVGKIWVAPRDACPTAAPECPRNLDAGWDQIKVGLAWHYKHYAREQLKEDRERYAFAEQEARKKRAGLWSDPAPMPPWIWRQAKRN